MSAQVLQEFFVKLGFEVDTDKVKEFEQETIQVRNGVFKMGAIVTAAAAGIGLFVSRVAESLDDLGDFADLNEVSAAAVQQFGQAAQMNGSSLEAAKSSIAGLNKVVGEAALGLGRGAMTFQKLGLEAKNADGSVKSFDQMLEEIAGKMQGLSRQEQIAMAEKLGIDRSLVPMLSKGSEAMREFMAAAKEFSLTDSEIATAGKFQDTMDQLKFAMRGLRDQIAVHLMPVVRQTLEGFFKWLRANREIIKSNITKFVMVFTALLGTLWDWTVRVADSLASIVKWLTTTRSGLIALAAALALITKFYVYRTFELIAKGVDLLSSALTVANTAALVTSAIIGGIIIALGLLIDDYVNWKEGNDSVIGDLIKQFPWLLDVIQTIENTVGALVDFWLEQWETLKGPLGDLGSSLWKLISILAELLWPVVKMIFTGWANILALVIPIVATLVGWIAEALVGAIAAVIDAGAWLADVFTSVFEGIKAGINLVVMAFDWARNKIGGFIDKVSGAIGKVASLLGLTGDANVKVAVGQSGQATAPSTANNSLNSKGGVVGRAGNSVNNSTTTQTTTITGTTIQINSPDPAKAGESVRKELDRMNKQETRNGQTAVAL